MKSCPTCDRTYEDTLTFYLVDGAVLSAPFDPQATLIVSTSEHSAAPRTETLHTQDETGQVIPRTIASSQTRPGADELLSTIASPSPPSSPIIIESPQPAIAFAKRVPKSFPRAWIVSGVIVLLVVAGIVGLIFLRDSSSRHMKLAEELSRQEKHEEAEAEFRKAVKLDPDNAEAHFKLAWELWVQEKTEEMETEMKTAIRLKPDRWFYRDMLGVFLQSRKKYPETEAVYKELIRLTASVESEKNSQYLYYWKLGNALQDQNKDKEAEMAFREALRLSPNVSALHGYLGKALVAQGRYTEAKAEYQEALRLEPTEGSFNTALKAIEIKERTGK